MTTTGLRPPAKDLITNTRERILAMGGANTGKSYNFYCIARSAALSGSDAKFYVLDTDQSFGRMVGDEAFKALWLPDMSGFVNLVPTEANDWVTFMKALSQCQSKMRNQDWLMIDMFNPTWPWCQSYFTNRVFSQDLGDFFLKAREAMKSTDKKAQAFEGWKDWPVINKIYEDLQDKILRTPGNLYCTNEVKSFNAEQADKDIKLMFGPHGVIPVGQKRTPHLFSTILWMVSTIPGQRKIITIKDRSREDLTGMVVEDFSVDYLVDVGGWRLGDDGESEGVVTPITPKPKPNPTAILALAKAKKAAAEKAAVNG